jgi:hypothetical protein
LPRIISIGSLPQIWPERTLGADVVMILEGDRERTNKLSQSAHLTN